MERKVGAIILTGLVCLLGGCYGLHQEDSNQVKQLLGKSSISQPTVFAPTPIPDGMLIHRGVFSPDLKAYYYTLSSSDYSQFSVQVIEWVDGKWSSPKEAFFNSPYLDHGMSFSADGNTLYFSSTRPVANDSIPKTWHIWRSEKVNGRWLPAVFIDIPNLRHRLVSHPVVTNTGTLYFHVSNLDYSDMELMCSKRVNGVLQDAQKLSFSKEVKGMACTPYVSPDERYLIFALVGEELDLMISIKDDKGNWGQPLALDENINDNGKGNPYVTPGGDYLFYASGKHAVDYINDQCVIKYVGMAEVLERVVDSKK